jgi:hypothetical protein
VGGAAFDGGVEMPEGVELLDGLQGVERMLATWTPSQPGD